MGTSAGMLSQRFVPGIFITKALPSPIKLPNFKSGYHQQPNMSAERQWFVFYTKPRNEKKVAERLRKNGFEAYCPLTHTLRQWSDRKKKVSLPMFTSYVFGYLNEKERLEVVKDPGVLNFVFWLGKPAVVRDEEMAAIKEIEANGFQVEVAHERMEKGKRITIKEGAFKGLEGEVTDIGNNRIRLFIESLQCTVSFEYKQALK